MILNERQINALVILMIIIFFDFGLACATQPQYNYEPFKPDNPITHSYKLLIVDANGNSIEGAQVVYALYDRDDIKESRTYVTNADGLFFVNVTATPDPACTSCYRSKLVYEISKDGYYMKKGTLYSFSGTREQKKETVEMIRPIDYLKQKFVSSRQGGALKSKILTFIDLIKLESFIADASLALNSIDLIEYKKKKYLEFKFVSSNTYNSLKMSKYDIGKNVFDDVVRKVLNPLNEHISDPKTFYGYSLIVVGQTKSFADKDAYSKAIEYRFLIPEITVRKYKNQDISGQQVLNDSIILMDNERIELKLQ